MQNLDKNNEVEHLFSVPVSFEHAIDTTIHVFADKVSDERSYVFVIGDPLRDNSLGNPPLVRVHSSCYTGDLLDSMMCDCGGQLKQTLKIMGERKVFGASGGILIYLMQEGRGIGLENKLKAYALQRKGHSTYEANKMLGFAEDIRDFTKAANILKYFNIDKIQLLSNNPLKESSLNNLGIKVERVVPIITKANDFNRFYLSSKRDVMQHRFEEERKSEGSVDFFDFQDPMELFHIWFHSAMDKQEIKDPSAMTLSTASKSGEVSSRVVLLKQYSEEGFYFVTNFGSLKAKQIAENSKVALLFYWKELGMQIRIEGECSQADDKWSDKYFKYRPRASQLNAWASRQSSELISKEILQQEIKQFEAEFSSKEVARPPYWGGFLVIPQKIEFWKEGEARLHNRVQYELCDNKWHRKMLYP